jgi:hypothetical protein
MDRRLRLVAGGGAVAVLMLLASGATAGENESRSDNTLRERLSGYQEDPLTLSTTGTGHFRAGIGPSAGTISYALSYSGLEGSVNQAHIHFGGRAQSGGISVFLCSNLGNGPAGTQACPPAPAVVRGTIRPADVIGPTAQGIDPGEFDELVAAIRAGTTYVNVHSDKYPAGEIRAQLEDH